MKRLFFLPFSGTVLAVFLLAGPIQGAHLHVSGYTLLVNHESITCQDLTVYPDAVLEPHRQIDANLHLEGTLRLTGTPAAHSFLRDVNGYPGASLLAYSYDPTNLARMVVGGNFSGTTDVSFIPNRVFNSRLLIDAATADFSEVFPAGHPATSYELVEEAANSDLYVNDILTDTDSDGMNDTWEQDYGLDISDPSDVHSDHDGDLVTAGGEFTAGTIPTNGASYFFVESLTGMANRVLSFDTVLDRQYTLMLLTNVAGDAWAEVPASTIPGTGVPATYELTDNLTWRSYRVLVEKN